VGVEINASFLDLVRRSRFWLQHEENDHVDQDYLGSRVRIRCQLRRPGVCWSQNLCTTVRRLGRPDWLPLGYLWRDQRTTSDDGRPRAGDHLCRWDRPVRNRSLIAGAFLLKAAGPHSAARDQIEVKRSVSVADKSADANRADSVPAGAGNKRRLARSSLPIGAGRAITMNS
jgi:hypothetical protein